MDQPTVMLLFVVLDGAIQPLCGAVALGLLGKVRLITLPK